MSGTTSAGSLSVVIAAIDRASPTLRRIGQTVRLPAVALGNLGGQVRALGDLRPVQRLTAGLRGLGRVVMDLAPPISVLAGAGTVAGIVAMTRSWASFGAQLGTDAGRLQMTVRQLGAFQGAARLAGASAEGMTSSLEGLGTAVIDALGGRNDTALQYFRMLGVSIRDATGQARTAGEVLPEVADGIARIRDPRLQGRVIGALGISPEMLGLMQRGSAGIRELMREAGRYGLITEDGAKRAEQARVAQVRLGLAGQGLVNTLTVSLAPALTGVMNSMTNWISRTDGGQAAVRRLSDGIEGWISGGGPDRFIGAMDRIGSGISSVVGFMGGWENAVTALGIALSVKLLAPLVQIGVRLTSLLALRPAGWLLGLLGIAGGAKLAIAAGAAYGGYQLYQGLTDPTNNLSSLNPFLNRATTARGQPSSRVGAGSPSAAPTDRQRQAYEFFIAKGWTPEQATGMVANLRHESGANLDHAAVGDGGQAYGVAQWHPDRQRLFRLWAGRDIRGSSFEDQLGFIDHELRTSERRAGLALRNARTAADAASVFSLQYERPAGRFGEAASRARTADGLAPQLASPAANTQTPRAQVDITIRGAPAGTSADVRSPTGDLNTSARVERAMPGSGP